MTLELFIKIAQFQVGLSFVNLLVATFRFNKRSKQTKLVGVLFFLSVLGHVILYMLHLRGKDVNYPVGIEYIAYICVLMMVYSDALKNQYKPFFNISATVFLLFAMVNLFFWQKGDINTYTMALGALIIIPFCILYLYRLMVDLPVKNLHRLPMFWYNGAALVYSAGSLFIFLFVSYLTQVSQNNLLVYWSIHNVFNIVKTLLFFVGLCMDLQLLKVASSSELVQ